MQISRLFKIVYYLLENGKATAAELAEEFEVSIRTVYRDLDTISAAGIPIYATQGKGGGVYLLEDYVLEKSLLSEEEKEQILMALQALTATDGEIANELLSKLSALFQLKSTDWIEVDFSDWVKNTVQQDIFNGVKKAIFEKRIIAFSYFDNKGFQRNRSVKPLKLLFKSKDWYLYGFCLLRNDYRFFKLTRMKDLVISKKTFVREPDEIPKIKAEIQNDTTVEVDLKFSPQVAFRVYDEFTDRVATDSENNLYVTASLPNNERMYSYLLTFGEFAEVLSPDFVREEMLQKLKSLLKKYET